jgi:beta-glucosidase
MGCISRLAKEDGYIIGMAPPQSYMDLHSTSFSRYVNLTEPDRPWHDDFHYFGANVYSYLLSKYGDYIDFVSLQFYESYSRAAMSVYHYEMAPAAYLQFYVNELVKNGQVYQVNFDEDPTLNYPSQKVSLPLSKLVFGFANGWAADSGEKTLFFEPKDIDTAYQNLAKAGTPPRGLMYWVIGEEGKNGVYYTAALNKILKIR